MKSIFYLIVFLYFFTSTVLADGYTYTNPNYNDPYYYYSDEGTILTPINPSYPSYPPTVYPESIIPVPNPPPVHVYPNPPRYPNYPRYPDYSDYSTYPINFDRGSNYRSGLSTYYVGESVRLNLTAVDNGTFYLFVIDPNGSVRKLLPNYRARSSYSYPVTSGRNYRIPGYGDDYKLLAVEPRGYHKLIGVLVSIQPSYHNYGPYSNRADLFSGIYSESSLSSRINQLRQQSDMKISRYEGKLLVQ